jgi:hypothetical protein
MGLFVSEKTKQERAKAKAAAARADNKRHESEAAIERNKAKAAESFHRAQVESQEAKLAAELREKELLMKMTPEEREAYIKQSQEAKLAEYQLQKQLKEEQERRIEEAKQKKEEQGKRKQEALQKKYILMSKAQHYDFEIHVDGGNTTIMGSISLIKHQNPFVYIKMKVENTGFFNKNKESYEIEISIQNIYNIKLKKSILGPPILFFSLVPTIENDVEQDEIYIDYNMPLNNYQILKKYVNDKGELELRMKRKDADALQIMIDEITKLQENI